jgi:ribosome maturation factor RimP
LSKRKIIELVPEVLHPFLEAHDYALFNVEYLKEGKDWFLRVYIDRPAKSQAESEPIGIDDCEKVSRYLSDRLDEMDPIERNYYLEVSSPGLDRPLLRDSDFEKYKGHEIDVFLYKPINGQKMMTGQLVGLQDNIISIMVENKELMALSRDLVAKVKLTVIF